MDTRRGRWGRSRSRRSLPVALVAPVVLLLLAMAALPSVTFAAPPQAPAAQVTPEAEDGEDAALDQADDPAADDQAEDQPVEDETIGAPAPGTASIIVNKRECLADYLGVKSSYLSYCFPGNQQVEFQIFGPNLTETFQTGNGFALPDVEPGVFSIREIVPQGWYPTVYCQKANAVLSDGGAQQVVIYDGYYEVEVLAGEYLYCDWFNIPPVKADLIVNKHFCPAVSDTFDAYAADIFELAAECQEEGPPVDFTLAQGGNEIGTETAEGDLPVATFSQFTPGESTVSETLPEGYGEPIVSCGVNDGLGNDISGSEPTPVDNDRITWLVGNGHVVFCDWFNVPSDEYGSISVVKITCPESEGYGGGGYEWYSSRCTETTADVSFKLDGASTGNPGSQPTDANGQVTWDQREADTYYVTEEAPEDGPSPYGRPAVFCSYYLPDALEDRQWEQYDVDDEGRITFDLDDGQYIACVWFNLYDDEYGSVTVLKITCPEDFGYGSGGYDYYLSECTERTPDVSFKLDGASTGNPGSQVTDADGYATWGEREADTFYLTEEAPEDEASPYGRPVVYCAFYQTDGSDLSWDEYPTDGEGRATFDLAYQQDITCVWFNLYADEYGSITIYKYTCAEDFASGGGSYEYYLSECDEPTADVSFKLDGDSTGNPGSQTTDQDGKVVWDEREADTYFVTEEDIPTGYGKPVVYCAYTSPDPTWDEYSVDDEYQIEFDLGYQEDIVCYWFNIYDDEYGSVTVYKYTCPEAFAPEGGSYQYYESECPEWTPGVSFKLDGASTGNPGSQETDDDGVARWGEREADTYFLNEEEPEDGPYPYGVPVVYCYYVDPSSSGDPEWDEYSSDDEGRIQFDLAYQQDIVCVWFNIYKEGSSASPSPSSSPRPSASPSPSPSPRPTTTGPGTTGPNTQTGPATLIVQKYDCDEGYEWREDEADPEEDCTERPDGIVFELEVIRTTPPTSPSPAPQRAETSGDEPEAARFGGLRAGEYRLTEQELAEGTLAFILTCESSIRDFEDYPYYPFALAGEDGSVTLSIVAGETLECAWYNVPPKPADEDAPSGTPEGGDYDGLVIQAYVCGGEEQSVEACDPQADIARYSLIPVSGGDPETLETDETGRGSVEGLDGVYTLVQVGQEPCVVESSDVDAQGNLSLSAEKGTLVRVYNCA